MLKNLDDVDLQDKKVLFRVAYDVPLEKKGKKFIVDDNTRLKATLPTLRCLLKKNCSIVILTWLGRPGGQKQSKFSLEPVARELSKLIKKPVQLAPDCVGKKTSAMVKKLQPGEILFLENVRFNKSEDKKDFTVAKKLVHDCELIVFDAFAQAHRVVPSVTGILAEKPGVAGYLMQTEVEKLNEVITSPKKPFVVIMGGAKIDDKLNYVKLFLEKANKVILGGGLANAFVKAQGCDVGASTVNSHGKSIVGKIDVIAEAKKLIKKYPRKIILPVDFIAANELGAHAKTKIYDCQKNQLAKGWMLLDIGPKTIVKFSREIKQANSIFWNGPLGVFEINKFVVGSKKIAQAIAKNRHAQTVIGGGDTESAVSRFRLGKKYSHVSTGGGASLEFVALGSLPVLKYLKK